MDWLYEWDWEFQWVIFFIFAFAGLIQLYYYWIYFSRLAYYKPKSKNSYSGPVSVVISVRNEYNNLTKNLQYILSQDYHDYEVVVVDDASDDDSAHFLQQMEAKYKHLKVVSLKESVNFFKGKKLPLSVGIKSAKSDVVLLTDADCRPSGPHWITRMADNFEGSTELVLGYGGYEKRPGLLNKLIRFDTLFVAMQYLSMALSGKPYMGVGRNLAYKKELFFRVKGFTSHYKILAGEDDLFVNQTANKHNVAIEVSPHAHTFSTPKNSFRAWLQQKQRHLTTRKYYKRNHRRMMGLFSFTHFIYYPLLLAIFLLSGVGMISLLAAGIFLLRFFTQLIIFSRVSNKFNEQNIFPFSFLFDLVYPFINFIFVLASLFYNKQTWR
jgi:cellulose synthase/poly-beta-1,6-N-acetylglucosamine synthase-like glycosyltransferase